MFPHYDSCKNSFKSSWFVHIAKKFFLKSNFGLIHDIYILRVWNTEFPSKFWLYIFYFHIMCVELHMSHIEFFCGSFDLRAIIYSTLVEMLYMFSWSNSVVHTFYNRDGSLKDIWIMINQTVFFLFMSVLDYETLHKIFIIIIICLSWS